MVRNRGDLFWSATDKFQDVQPGRMGDDFQIFRKFLEELRVGRDGDRLYVLPAVGQRYLPQKAVIIGCVILRVGAPGKNT